MKRLLIKHSVKSALYKGGFFFVAFWIAMKIIGFSFSKMLNLF